MKKLTEMAVKICKRRGFLPADSFYFVVWQLVKIVKGETTVILESKEYAENELNKVQKIARSTAVQLEIKCYTENDWKE